MNGLIFGFQPFSGRSTNLSQILAEKIGNDLRIHTQILPVTYEHAWPLALSALERVKPQFALLLGECSGDSIRLELTAHNLDHSNSADEAGHVRQNSIIDSAFPTHLATRLPVSNLQTILPSELSQDAGGFLCNHLFFRLLTRPELISTGLIHVPRQLECATIAPMFAGAVEKIAEVTAQLIQNSLEIKSEHLNSVESPRG